MIAGDYFVTPHAVQQFQRRIRHLAYNYALAAIIRGLQHPDTRWVAQPEQDGHPPIIKARAQSPYCFRAIIIPQSDSGGVVTTILKSGKPGANHGK